MTPKLKPPSDLSSSSSTTASRRAYTELAGLALLPKGLASNPRRGPLGVRPTLASHAFPWPLVATLPVPCRKPNPHPPGALGLPPSCLRLTGCVHTLNFSPLTSSAGSTHISSAFGSLCFYRFPQPPQPYDNYQSLSPFPFP